ncbi:hypothetical protein FRB97_007220 [Tulasnella sp. 331]|nr:hypothetical protein FRB97_007220 [Tulasnella sp. 331]
MDALLHKNNSLKAANAELKRQCNNDQAVVAELLEANESLRKRMQRVVSERNAAENARNMAEKARTEAEEEIAQLEKRYRTLRAETQILKSAPSSQENSPITPKHEPRPVPRTSSFSTQTPQSDSSSGSKKPEGGTQLQPIQIDVESDEEKPSVRLLSNEVEGLHVGIVGGEGDLGMPPAAGPIPNFGRAKPAVPRASMTAAPATRSFSPSISSSPGEPLRDRVNGVTLQAGPSSTSNPSASTQKELRSKRKRADDKPRDDPTSSDPSQSSHKRRKSEKAVRAEPNILANEAACARYAACNAVSLTDIRIIPGLHDQSVSRYFLTETYGGCCQYTYNAISNESREDRRHLLKAFFCSDPRWNPYIPQRYGARGLYFSIFDRAWSTPTPLIVRLTTNQWQYMGHYVSQMSDPLTKEEWCALSQETKNIWLSNLLVKSWAKPIRIRVRARKANQAQPPKAVIDRLTRNRKDKVEVTLSDMESAFREGHEPTGYDEAFQRGLISEAAEWIPTPRKTQSGKAVREKGKRRETSEIEDISVQSSNSEEDHEEDDDNGEGLSGEDDGLRSELTTTDEEDDDVGASSRISSHDGVQNRKQMARPTRQKFRKEPSMEV